MEHWDILSKLENENEHSENIPKIFANFPYLTLGMDIANTIYLSLTKVFGVSLLAL